MRRPFHLCSPSRIVFSSSSYSPDHLLPPEVSPPPSALLRRRLIVCTLRVGATESPSAPLNTFDDLQHDGQLISYPRPGRQVP